MKRITAPLAAALLLLVSAGGALAQTSDYEVIESFKAKQRSISESLKAARDLGQIPGLESEIGRLEADYAQYQKLLGQGLYPATYDSSIAALREQLAKASERVRLADESRQDKAKIVEITRKSEADDRKIEGLSRENEEFRRSVEKLNQEVKELSARVEQITAENAGLVQKIKALQAEGKRDKETIAKLQALTEKLNANIRDRDELIVKMMDSFFGEYSKAGLTDAQKKDLFANVQGKDYVGKIVSTLDENVRYAETTILSAQDAKLVREEQKKLAGKWSELKPYIGKLYPDEQTRVRDLATVDSRLADWKRNLDDATWKGIRQVFASQNIAIGAFRNGGEFSAQLLSYIDGQVKNPSRDIYNTFRHRVWDSPIKDSWLPLVPVEELSQQQRADIESRIALWEKAVAALFWRLVVFCGAGLALLAVVILLILKKRQPKAPASAGTTPPAP